MKNIYKHPFLYYIAIPVIVGLWPLLVWAVYLPNAKENIKGQQDQYKIAEDIMLEILALDPERLEITDPNDAEVEFTYDRAVRSVANICGLQPSEYDLSTDVIGTSGEQTIQNAKVSLTQVDIVTFTRFFSMIQSLWANLQCESVRLRKKEKVPDMWDVDITFKYYY